MNFFSHYLTALYLIFVGQVFASSVEAESFGAKEIRTIICNHHDGFTTKLTIDLRSAIAFMERGVTADQLQRDYHPSLITKKDHGIEMDFHKSWGFVRTKNCERRESNFRVKVSGDLLSVHTVLVDFTRYDILRVVRHECENEELLTFAPLKAREQGSVQCLVN
jgi:hypothetical protein